MVLTWVEILLLGLVCCLFIHSTWNSMYKDRNLPPGPTPLPLIGNLLQIERGQIKNSFMKLTEKYGSVYTLYFGPNPVVVISGYEAVREALITQGDDFGARGKIPTLDKFAQGYGISFSNGERWRQLRGFTSKTLRNLGFGKKSFESKIHEEAKCVVEELKNLRENPIDPTKLLMDASTNILLSIIFGDRSEYKDERFSKLLGYIEETFNLISSPWGQLQSVLPQVMDYVPGPHQKITAISEELVSYIKERVKTHQQTLDPNKARDFIDAFLIKIKEEKNNPTTEFTMRNLLLTVHNLFIAGAEAVSTTLKHGLLILLKHPEIEAKVYEEIDRVIGQGRAPNINDRVKMPYTNAVVHEIHRFADIVPFNIPHMTAKDTQFRGYTIPKGTDVYILLYSVHRDPGYFSTPYKFNPNHFLDENGGFKRNEAMMAFSAGKRVCPGENLGRMIFFLFLTTLLQNFTLSSERKFTEADIAPRMAGFLNAPIRYKLSFIQR
ncbi:cytochrome P450 2G1-like [Spea bombifrons]|uniref:cytochrome P450 2G1-like n=1 Tax=Spea bombifrons TaxID=233779 RepID=UPI00234A6670|nr:cytochrome P450 2G1-like [Spea bombifrons]